MPHELTARVFGTTVTDPLFEQGWIRAWNAGVELLDAGGGVVAELARGSASGDPPAVVAETQYFAGILLPGSYRLRALADGWAASDQGAAVPPAPRRRTLSTPPAARERLGSADSHVRAAIRIAREIQGSPREGSSDA